MISTTPSPKERDIKQQPITSFLLKAPVKKGLAVVEPSKEKPKQGHDEQKKEEKIKKGEEKQTFDKEKKHTSLNRRTMTQKQDLRKLIPRKTTKRQQSMPIWKLS